MFDMKNLLLAAALVVLVVTISGCQQPAEKPAEEVKATPTPAETQRPERVELFSTSSTCFCHDGLRDSGGNDVSIVSEWKMSMMSHASKDPYWRAKISYEIEKFPELRDVIEEKCARCHMPMASVQATSDGIPVSIEEFMSPGNSMSPLAEEGVSCTLCHQILPGNLGEKDSFSGNFIIDMETKKPDRKIFGPYTPVRGQAMRNSAGFTPVFGEHVGKAELCAVCHTLYTPFLDDDGKVAGEFPEQTPYLEWLNSKFSPSTPCQKCHMPQADGVRISTMPPNLPERSPFFRHTFAGANVQMLGMMGADEGARNAEDLLKSFIGLRIVSTEEKNGKVRVVVEVENKAGHKFPTGFPSRRAWIHLTVYDGDGNIIFESGRLEGSRIVGESRPYEPHHDVIASEDDVQIYEAVMVDVNGNVTQTLLRAADYIKDNRIPPEGFDAENAVDDIAVKGKASEDGNFGNGRDAVTYIIDVSGARGPFEVRAELMYQSISSPFLEDLEKASSEEVRGFLKDFSEVEQAIVISSASATVS